jgi:hypothetical protein
VVAQEEARRKFWKRVTAAAGAFVGMFMCCGSSTPTHLRHFQTWRLAADVFVSCDVCVAAFAAYLKYNDHAQHRFRRGLVPAQVQQQGGREPPPYYYARAEIDPPR